MQGSFAWCHQHITGAPLFLLLCWSALTKCNEFKFWNSNYWLYLLDIGPQNVKVIEDRAFYQHTRYDNVFQATEVYL